MKVLMVTNIYPLLNVTLTNTTAVCHYFAKEWNDMGYEVKVVYNYNIYARIFHFIVKFFEKRIASLFPTVINKIRYKIPFQYQYEGVTVLLNPIYKFFPKTNFPSKSIDTSIRRIKQFCDSEDFIPDIIVGHFLNPSIRIVSELKKLFPKSITSVILHGKLTHNDVELVNANYVNIDIWGFRSEPIKQSFENKIGICLDSYMCYSGVPKMFLKEHPIKKFDDGPIEKYVYVGNLIKRKHPLELAKALSKICSDYSLCYVGDGAEKRTIIKYAQEQDVLDRLVFVGRQPREKVGTYLENAQVFVMISSNETFGLVYLEAMSHGCITIASKNEGMQGIIKDGENGFLCEAGNVDELSSILKKINSLTKEEKYRISRNGVETAANFSDKKVAEDYILSIRKFANI